MKGVPVFPALFENDQKLNKKKFFQLNVTINIKTKTNRNYYVYEPVRSLVSTSLFTLKFDFVLTLLEWPLDHKGRLTRIIDKGSNPFIYVIIFVRFKF